MSRLTEYLGVGFVAAALGLGTLGCNQAGDSSAAGGQEARDEEAGGSAETGHGHSHEGEGGEIAATLAKLSPEDRATAERQRICPVSQEPLGSMGVPPKVTIEGRDVFICCGGCKEALEADPDEYLANLSEE